jgi:glutathione S-transferase
MTIKIYGDLGSGTYRRVAAAAKIMGIDIEHVNVDLFKGESHSPAFLKLNPHGLTPVLQDGDTVLWESSAINIYLAEKVGSPLLGKTAKERYEVLQWMFWSGEQWRVFGVFMFNERVAGRAMGQTENPSIVDLALKNIRAAAAVLDEHLANRQFIEGDGAAHPHLARQLPTCTLDCLHGQISLVQRADGVLVERLSDVGRGKAPCRA